VLDYCRAFWETGRSGSPETRCVVLHFLSDVTMTQRTAAAQYLFDEGFIEFADGQIDLDRLTMDQ
jgi:hypothetical protein